MLVRIAPTFIGVGTLAMASLAYLLQQRCPQPPAPIDPPPLPIVIAGVVFNVPPAAIRIPMQRRAGPQERIDLAYQWPDLTPPDSRAVATPRLFVTIESAQPPLPATERLNAIYPRYADAPAASDPAGLTMARFRDGTPYQREDVIYDASAPDRFLVRCSRSRGELTLASCLYERAVGARRAHLPFPARLASRLAIRRGRDRPPDRALAARFGVGPRPHTCSNRR
jgi:hypothetical protein